MATLRRTSQPKTTTVTRRYNQSALYGWQAQNQSALDILNEYQKKIQNNEWLSTEDRAKYKAAIDEYTSSGNALRKASQFYGTKYTADEEKSWQDSLSSLSGGYTSINDFYNQFADEKAYGDWRKYVSPIDDVDYGKYVEAGKGTSNPNWNQAHAPIDIGGWQPFGSGQSINNMVTFAEANKTAGAMNAMQGTGDKYSEIVNLINNHMTPEEKERYNYYIGKGDTAAAEDYLNYMTDVLRQRQGGQIAAQVDNNALELLTSGLAGMQTAVSGYQNFVKGFIGGQDLVQTNSLQYAHQQTAENNKGAWKVMNDLANTTGNMAPSLVVGALTGGTAGAIAMGVSSAGNSYADMIQQGYTKNQARAYGLLTGASEAALSYALGGISKIGGGNGGIFQSIADKVLPSVNNGLARFAIEIGGNMADEALEEAAQTVLESVFKHAVTLGEEKIDIDWGEVAYSGLLGALSAGTLEGIPSAISTGISNYKANIVNGGLSVGGAIQAAISKETKLGEAFKQGHASVTKSAGEYANYLTELDADNKAAKYVQDRISQGKNVSGYQINRLATEIDTAITNNDTTAIKAAVEARLTELGERGDTSAIAEAITKKTIGEKLTARESNLLKESTVATRVANEVNPENIKSGEYSSNWAESIGTKRLNADVYNRQTKAETANSTPENAKSTEAKISPSGERVSPTVVTKNAEGKTVKSEISGIEVDGGKATFTLANGEKVNADKATFQTETQQVVAKMAVEKISRVEGFSTEAVTAMVKGYNDNLTPGEYNKVFTDAFNAGKENLGTAVLRKMAKGNNVSEATLFAAYDIGREFTKNSTSVLKTGAESGIINTVNAEATNEGRQGLSLRGSVQRNNSQNTQGQLSQLESGAGQAQSRGEVGGYADSEIARFVNEGREVTVADLGILGGSKYQKVRILDREHDTKDTREAREYGESRGLNVIVITGGAMQIEGKFGKIDEVNGYILGKNMIIRADHSTFTSTQIARHEGGHDMIAKGEVDIKAVRNQIKKVLQTDEGINEAAKHYEEAYSGTGLTADEIWEEMICDSLGDMNIFSKSEKRAAAAEVMKHALPAIQQAVAETKTEATNPDAKTEGKASRDIGGKVAKYLSDSKVGKANREYLYHQLIKLYSGISDGIADGIAIANGKTVFIVDSGRDNGKLDFGVRRMRNISADIGREQFIRRANDTARSKGDISDELLERLGYGNGSDSGLNMRRESGSKLQADTGKSHNQQSGISGENADQRGLTKGKASRELEVDSEGNALSPAVAKRFANSKVVDENGRLKVVYHGTVSGEFDIFDKSKGSVEGDFGSGFYFTDKETDVEKNYEFGGPDFDNKVWRRAEQIWDEDPDIDMEDAREQAKKELYKESHRFEVYLNIENPAIVGETILFDNASYLSEYNEEDYDNYDDYIGDVDQLVTDDIDKIIWDIERNVDLYSNTDSIRNALYEAYYEGGVSIEKLKEKINELYLESNNGDVVSNEVTRQIIESLGYDGIIDPTVATKFKNMGMEADTTHYIVFKPNQIKDVGNKNPTDNPNIHYSRELDIDYMDAVNRGDMETAQKMVDEAAKEAGYTVKGLHATNAEFTVFDINKTSPENFHGKGIYFTNSVRDVENNYENYEGPDPWQKIEGRAYELVYDKYGISYEDTLTSDSEIIDKLNECYDIAIDEFNKSGRRITAYLRFDNPLIIEKGMQIPNDYDGYDGIVDKQVYENIGHSGMDENTIHYVVFNPNNIKSADPVTYDNDGNVIPLSERFNPENKDIRFSRELDLGYDESIEATKTVTNRELLANALESAAQSDDEYSALQDYKKNIKELNKKTYHLSKLKEEIKKLSFGKGQKDTKRLAELKEKATKLERSINYYDRQLVRLEAMQPVKDLVQRERSKAYKAAAEKGREALHRNVEGRHKSEARAKIKKLKQKFQSIIEHPTDRQYVPVDLMSAMIDVCDLIDTSTPLYKADGSINKAQQARNEQTQRLLKLKAEYDALAKSADYAIAYEYEQEVADYIQTITLDYANRNISEMTLAELTDLYQTMRSIEETLRDARKLIGWSDAMTVYEAGDSIIEEQAKIGEKRKQNGISKVDDSIVNLSLSPVRAVLRMAGYNEDSALYHSIREIENGTREQKKFVMDAVKKFEGLTTGKNASTYEKAIYDPYGKELIDKNGNKFHVTKMQMMQAIMSYEREMANEKLHHVSNGGFTFADIKLLGKGEVREAVSAKYAHTITLGSDVAVKFMSELANDKWAQEYMAEARNFFDVTAKEAINEANMKLKHRIIATGKNYIPYEVNSDFIVREINSENDIQQVISGYGMLKDLKEGASQPLIITGLNNVLDRHIEQVGNVAALAVPIRNFNKIWNVKSTDGSTTVREKIKANWGTGGEDLITQAVKDVQGTRKQDNSPIYKAYKKVKSGVIAGTFLGNWSVVLKQIGSMYTATSMLNYRDPASMMVNLLATKANRDAIAAEVNKYTAVAWVRGQGLSDAELYDLKTTAKKSKVGRAVDKLPPALNAAKWITQMDYDVALSLWKYAKEDTAKRTGLKGEELLRATADYYNDVIENTQSMSDALHRPEVQKSDNIASETLGIFKTDLYQNAGLLRVAFESRMANPSKETTRALVKAVCGTLSSMCWASLITSVMAAFRYKVGRYRDEEDDEITLENWLKVSGGDMLEEMFGYMLPLFGSEAAGLLKAWITGETYEFDNLTLEAINGLSKAITSAGKLIREGEDDPEKIQRTLKNLLVKATSVFGVPANNVTRFLDAVRLHAKDIANGEFLSFEAELTSPNAQRLYNAYIEGDSDKIEKASRNYEDQKAIDAALRKKLRDNDPRMKEAAEAYITGDYAKYNALRAEIVAEGIFDNTLVTDALKAEITYIKNKDKESE